MGLIVGVNLNVWDLSSPLVGPIRPISFPPFPLLNLFVFSLSFWIPGLVSGFPPVQPPGIFPLEASL